MTDRVVVGAIGGAFGVKGEVRLKSFCAAPEDIANYAPLFDETGQEYALKITRAIKGGFAARLSGVRFKDEADALRGVKLLVSRDKLPNLPDDEFYHADLIGLDAVDTGGVAIGKVAAVQNHGAGDILELRNISGSVLLPFTLANVPTVDLAAGRLVIDLPDDVPETPPPSETK